MTTSTIVQRIGFAAVAIAALGFVAVFMGLDQKLSPKPLLAIPTRSLSLTDDPLDGNASAPLVLIEYSDFQCPFCAKFTREVLPQLRDEFISTGMVAHVFRHFPLVGIHPSAMGAAKAADCALPLGQFWVFHDFLFRDASNLSRNAMEKFAATRSLNVQQFSGCLDAEAGLRVNKNRGSGVDLGVKSTPSLLLGYANPDRTVQVTETFVGDQTSRIRSAIQRLIKTRGLSPAK